MPGSSVITYPIGRVGSMRLLRSFAPAGLVDAGIRRNLRLDAAMASLPRTPDLAK